MGKRVEVKEIEALIEKRALHEQGLREEAVVVNQGRNTCEVLLTDKSGQFHIHRYFLLGTSKWGMSYKIQRKSAIDTIKELLHKRNILGV